MSFSSFRPAGVMTLAVGLLGLILIVLFSGCERSTPDNAKLKLKAFSDLAAPGVRIGIVDPDLGPAGRYARRALARYARTDSAAAAAIEKNIVTYESHVRALLDKLLQHEIDAAFIYRSDTHKQENRLEVIALPAVCAVVPEYALARLKESRVPVAAAGFADWLVRPAALLVWRKYGFIPRFSESQFSGSSAGAGQENGTRAVAAAGSDPDRSLQGKELTVFAAAVFYEVLPVFAQSFQAATGVEVKCEFAGSGRLYRKLLQGAVGEHGADLFLSAAPRYVDGLVARGRADRARVFMANELVAAVYRSR